MRKQIKTAIREYVVDVDMGSVDVFCRFGSVDGMPDSHLFRLIDGKLRYAHTLSMNVPRPAGSRRASTTCP
jgi:hypothetical protein